jgi:non-canonical (house-cleaning) NTP pyrophosphatase
MALAFGIANENGSAFGGRSRYFELPRNIVEWAWSGFWNGEIYSAYDRVGIEVAIEYFGNRA